MQLRWELGRPLKIKHLAFRCGSGFLAVVGALEIWRRRERGADLRAPAAFQTPRTHFRSTTSLDSRRGSQYATAPCPCAQSSRASPASPSVSVLAHPSPSGHLSRPQLHRNVCFALIHLPWRQGRHRGRLRHRSRRARRGCEGSKPLARAGGDLEEEWRSGCTESEAHVRILT